MNGEIEGQLTLFSNRVLYPIPKLAKRWRDEEGYIDDWHYVDEEQPTENDYYWTVWLFNDCYIYEYGRYVDGWQQFNDATKKWQEPFKFNSIIAWMKLPTRYAVAPDFIRRIV